MASKTKSESLRVVADDEKAPVPVTLAEAIEGGDYLQILKAQRRDIAVSLPKESGAPKAALHRQLALISKEIQALEEKAKVTEAESVPSDVDDEAWDPEAI